MQRHIVQQSGGVDSFVEGGYKAGLNDLVAQAIYLREQLQECHYIRGELSRIITTHVVEIVRCVHLFIYFLEKGNTKRYSHFRYVRNTRTCTHAHMHTAHSTQHTAHSTHIAPT
jgi:hypothetical protein